MTPRIVIIILGKLGKGPADIYGIHGALVDSGMHYDQAVAGAQVALADLIAQGKVEKHGACWRLAASVPYEPNAGRDAVAKAIPGTITAAEFWDREMRRKGGK